MAVSTPVARVAHRGRGGPDRVWIEQCAFKRAKRLDAGLEPAKRFPSSAPASAQGEGLHVVVIGDSISFADHFCPGCVGFAEQYGSALETTTSRPVDVANRSRDDGANLGDIEVQVQRDSELRTELGEADVVIVSVGFNNGPPWNTGGPCGGFFSRDLQIQVDALLAYDPACYEAGAASFAPDYDTIYGGIEGWSRRGGPRCAERVQQLDRIPGLQRRGL